MNAQEFFRLIISKLNELCKSGASSEIHKVRVLATTKFNRLPAKVARAVEAVEAVNLEENSPIFPDGLGKILKQYLVRHGLKLNINIL